MSEWIRGEDTHGSEAAAQLVAELALRGLMYLRALEAQAKASKK